MRIKKISPTTPANGNIENQYGTSQTNAYSEEYANTTFATKDVATTSANGLMSASDKTLLNQLEIPIDSNKIQHYQLTTVGDKYAYTRLKNFLPSGAMTSTSYSTNYLQLGYIKTEFQINNYKSNTTLIASNAFYDLQHWSTHILTVAQASSVKANYLKVGGNNRQFYFKKDTTNNRIYVYAKVEGGNGFGDWNISLLNNFGCEWVTSFNPNVAYESSWVEINAVS